jgi:AcrR family transcriptional regulator
VTAHSVEQVRGRPGTREALLDAVDALTAERGWAACSLQAVARRAGLTTGAVYSTFGSRGALLVAAMLRRTEAVSGLPEGERDLARAVAEYARTYWSATRDEPGRNLLIAQLDLLRVGATELAVGEALARANDDLMASLAAQLTERGASGDPLVLARRMVGVLQGLTLQHVVLGVEVAEEEFVAAAQLAVGCEPRRKRRLSSS